VSPKQSTEEINIDRSTPGAAQWAAPETSAWWLRFKPDRLFVPRSPGLPEDPGRKRSGNTSAESTVSDPSGSTVPALKPVARRRPFFGRRAFKPLYQWEGVVEEVSDEGFRARLRPFENGSLNRSQVEYADFEFVDLADESDYDLVEKDAVFYWTVGRYRNPAGTYTNTSLVRFRRLAPPTARQLNEASREAAELQAELGGDPGAERVSAQRRRVRRVRRAR
jgi:hypothetical protein